MSNDDAPQPSDNKLPIPPPLRSLIPLILLMVGAGTLAALQFAQVREILSPANAFLAKASSAAGTLILLFAWFVLLSSASRKTRYYVGALGVGAVLVALAALRIEGVSGDIIPHVSFRWAPHADETLGEIESDADASPVDLTATTDHDYPQFLGANRDATLHDVGLARDWSSEKPSELWRQPIGAAWSAFAIVGPYAVTQEQRGPDELITCYELATGNPRWSHATPVRFQETLAGIGPRATPTVHEGKVYAMGALGHLTCLDGATGEQLWQQHVVASFDPERTNPPSDTAAGNPIWGKSCSPLIYEDLVIASAGAPDGKSLIAFDKQTGEFRWSGGDDASSYSSPTVMTLDGVPQIVIVNATSVVAHDPKDGRVVWERDWPEADAGRATPTVAQPVEAGNDRILLTKGYGAGSALWQIRRDGDAWTVEELWRNLRLKTKFTNPVIHEGFVYALDEGILQCVDLETGRAKWKRGRYGHGQLILVDDLLLVQSETGDLALVEADPKKFRELARITALSGTCWNPPALAGRTLLLRSNSEAVCYELPAASP